MKTFDILAFLILLLAFAACEDDITDFELDLPQLEHSTLNLSCPPSFDGIIINTDSAYQVFQEQNEPYCYGDLPEIDFSQFTVLGRTRSAGCNFKAAYKNVYIDETAKKYVFQTILEGEGNCLSLLTYSFWVTVPKIPEDYEVVFVEREY